MIKKSVTLSVCLIILLSFFLSGCVGPKKVTMEKFNKIQSGMSYKQVAQIMEDPGELGASTSMPGVPGVMEPLENKIYIWKNADGSNMNVQFQNDKVMGKAQAGL